MKFRIIYQQSSHNAQSPIRVIEHTSGREVGWINRYLDREYVRRLANTSLRAYAYNLLHFVRWWDSIPVKPIIHPESVRLSVSSWERPWCGNQCT
jgi:hypothetical protein